jgi:hypothetical protein
MTEAILPQTKMPKLIVVFAFDPGDPADFQPRNGKPADECESPLIAF